MSHHILASGSKTDTLQAIEQILKQTDQFQVSIQNTSADPHLQEKYEDIDLFLQTEGTTEEDSLNPVRFSRQNGFTGPIIYLVKPDNFSLQWITKLTDSGVTQIALDDPGSFNLLPDQIVQAIQEYEAKPDDLSHSLKRHQTALEAYRASIRSTAHAINNFLTTINGRVQIAQFSYLQDDDLPADKVRHDINQIGSAAERIQTLVTVMQGLTELNQAWHQSNYAELDVQQLIEEQIEKIKQTELQG